MKYEEALQHKEEALESADESVLKLYHIIIAPANTDESSQYIEAFLENPESFDDESCKRYSTDNDFQVVSFGKES